MRIGIKRVYDPVSSADGLRVLVDRLWPRGLKKADACVDVWAKEMAPTASLRKWFAHQEERFSDFRHRYLAELEEKQDIAMKLLERAAGRPITLLFAARSRSCNHAVILQEFLLRQESRG
ncbi:MAG: DUF488 family protein [Acidobacteriota bacterium]